MLNELGSFWEGTNTQDYRAVYVFLIQDIFSITCPKWLSFNLSLLKGRETKNRQTSNTSQGHFL